LRGALIGRQCRFLCLSHWLGRGNRRDAHNERQRGARETHVYKDIPASYKAEFVR
jgi:hypothetical protein